MSEKENKAKESNSTTPFIKEVGKYFMEFLETDFHKRRLPRRSIKLHNDKGLLTGLNLSKYPSFYKVAYKLVNNAFTDAELTIQKGVYKADIPESLLDLIKKQINKVTNTEVTALIKELDDSIQQSSVKYKDDYLQAFNSVMENAGSVFEKHIILNLVKSIEKPLENNKLADENAIFQIEDELTNIFTKKVEDAVAESLKILLSGDKPNTKKLLKDVLDIEDIRASLAKFFEMFKVSDLFNDLHELYQNFKIEDKQEFYFYFYDISYQKTKYPIFYIPFSIERQSDTFLITFDSQIYINKKALAYIVQEYNLERGKKGALQTIADRIIYLADHEDDLPLVLQDTLTEISNFFDLDTKPQVAKPDIQLSKSLYVTASTNAYIALFDKSDEALLNDYEDILNAAADSVLMKGFQVLINDFIHENPESVAKPIRDDWDSKGVDERLVYKSPIPLNSEQQQILSAIHNDRCKYVLVEGPPGTGKSHTITAIVFDTILENKSVLVLSDKKEALDVVEKNIVNTLNKVRVDEKFQNPILRLGKTGNTYSQLLTQSSIEAITQQFRAVRSKYPNLNEQIDVAIEALRNGVKGQTDAYHHISLADVNELSSLKKHFDEAGFCIDVDEAISNPDSVEELTKIRSIFLKLKNRIKENRDVSFNFDYTKELGDENSKNLEEIISALEDIARLAEESPRLFSESKLSSLYDHVQKNKVKVEKLLGYLASVSELTNLFTKKKQYLDLLHVDKNELDSLATIKTVAQHALWLEGIVEKVKYFAKDSLSRLSSFDKSHSDDVVALKNYIDSAKKLRNGLLGYLGKKSKVEQLNQSFRKNFPLSKFDDPHKHLKELEEILGIYEYVQELCDDKYHPQDIDLIHLVTSILKDGELYFTSDQLTDIRNSFDVTNKVDVIAQEISSSKFSVMTLHDLNDIAVISEIGALYEELSDLMTKEKELIESNVDLKKIKNINMLFQKDNLKEMIGEISVCKEYVDTLIEVNDDVVYLKESSDNHKNSFAKAGIDNSSFSSLYENKLTEISDLEFEKLVRFITLHQELTEKFDDIKDLSYGERMKQVENIVTMQMTYLMDERFVDFTNDFKADAKALKQVIKEKKKFPKDQFSKLKNAFPCILAGIRDYAEYIPLEPEIFDLVIIDEASQVSIAQAFPALLRAKKVVVLGDSLQFSNVKSALARGDINKQYLGSLREVFLKTVATEEETDKVARLEKFNIKVSILDFFGFINNYQTRLVKHFRGYRELISYSNKFFYKNSLQVMKVRGLPISSVIKFSQVDHDGKEEMTKNTNVPEIEFIISELKALKDQDKKCTVGIITPHTNQQRLLYEKISDLPESDYFFDALKLKVMTFDTCQGEEMDIIYYSMVATETEDKLNYVFISDLNNIDLDDDEGKIKAQRLNVGLSRAKECMHFVLSKPIDQYAGTAKEFLQHYSNALLEAQKEPDSTSVDKNSEMEPLVLEWIKQTKFWDENKNNAEILPQFELGKYLKQLDQSYNHPNYRVDFLLVYRDEEGSEHKIIIEYDGFLEHFGDVMHVVNESNYEEYYSSEDVYRQHVLEGYGYRFIRINKFNLGENPIATLDSRIQEIVKKNFTITKS
ncbi:MAG: hypothetical protein HYR90_01470 [Candidatus Andersenbacteria bacterium]|nr:hypothetical protein [Candidatus Andersenbacteria bacterium]MBI3250827.1 hypothetical protein [Candidatus Andersenbacteria bacterium]